MRAEALAAAAGGRAEDVVAATEFLDGVAAVGALLGVGSQLREEFGVGAGGRAGGARVRVAAAFYAVVPRAAGARDLSRR